MNEKLQKVMSRAGLCSRRTAETWISAGRVSVNGKLAQLGDRVKEEDAIRVDGHLIKHIPSASAERRVLLYHKPVGEICARKDPEGRATIFDRLPKLHRSRWVAVGRLDFNTSGLMLLTTDGELARRLMHPSFLLEREYAVRIMGKVDQSMIDRLLKGITVDNDFLKFESITDAGGQGINHWYNVIVKSGKNRCVRRLWESQGVTVSRLMRIRYGNIVLLRSIREGRWEELPNSQINSLLNLVGMKN